jgi:UDP-N-acetylmuramate: L-alanyl-gamma-D-glutamyl-meso-diaminopimelate ligase
MEGAHKAFVYYNPHTVEHKKLSPITSEQVRNAFGSQNVEVFNDSGKLLEFDINLLYLAEKINS